MAYRAPVRSPVSTSFGTMHNRPTVLVRIEDTDGCYGWGEIFANWPSAGAEHRVRLLIEDVAELALGRAVSTPADLFDDLTRRTHIRALQCGEWGPFRQVIAGLDIAMHDLFARRAGLPVRQYLNPAAQDAVPFYASGIHIAGAETGIDAARKLGAGQFKVKVGFDMETDLAMINALLSGLPDKETLYADANQAWDQTQAGTFLSRLSEGRLGWLEEPMPADAHPDDWTTLASLSDIPLAGGENIAGYDAFSSVISAGALDVIQPDIVKWGGLTGCYAVARNAISAGRRYCPHFLGGGIGLMASAHLLAAVGGDGVLEVDANPNPLRDLLAPTVVSPKGLFQMNARPGLGIDTLPPEVNDFLTLAQETSL